MILSVISQDFVSATKEQDKYKKEGIGFVEEGVGFFLKCVEWIKVTYYIWYSVKLRAIYINLISKLLFQWKVYWYTWFTNDLWTNKFNINVNIIIAKVAIV